MSDTQSVINKLAILKEKYIKSLPDKLTDIYMEWSSYKEANNLKDQKLASHLHKLAGSAGMYELFELGETARAIELNIINFEGELSDDFIKTIEDDLLKLKTMVADLHQ